MTPRNVQLVTASRMASPGTAPPATLTPGTPLPGSRFPLGATVRDGGTNFAVAVAAAVAAAADDADADVLCLFDGDSNTIGYFARGCVCPVRGSVIADASGPHRVRTCCCWDSIR